MSEENELYLAFRPYSVDDGRLIRRTLRDELMERYLQEGIKWLINYEEPRPIVAQETGSPWQVADSIIYCLGARELFAELDTEWVEDLVNTIECKVLGGPEFQEGAVKYLLKNQGKDGSWDDRLYDTGAAVEGLALVFSTFRTTFLRKTPSLSDDIERAVSAGLNWICAHIRNQQAIDAQSLDIYSRIVRAFARVLDINRRSWRRVLSSWKRSIGNDPLDYVIEFLLSRSSTSTNDDSPEEINVEYDPEDRKDVIHSLACYLEYSKTNSKATRETSEQLGKELECLEKELLQGVASHPARSSAFRSYVLGVASYEKSTEVSKGQRVSHFNDRLVISLLNKQANQAQLFEDGSIYHDLYATESFVYLVLTLLRCWPRVDDPVVKLYNELLQRATKESQMSEERKQIYALKRNEQELRQQLRKSQRNNAIAWTAVSSAILLLISVSFSVYTYSIYYSQSKETFWGALGVFIAIILPFAGWVINSIWKGYRKA
jgi:hypothetical protein